MYKTDKTCDKEEFRITAPTPWDNRFITYPDCKAPVTLANPF